MNLLNDPWLPVLRGDDRRDKIAPWQIAETENPVIELAAPRADFQGALYQFLIGLLQTCFAPDDYDEWLMRWNNPPQPELLENKLSDFARAFELESPEGPAFLQDFDMPDGEAKPIAALLIDAPGGKTLKDNLDHFIKGGEVAKVCESCTASALFTLQSFAPSGGVGHRVGLRGGGPLTTLVLPGESRAGLWQKLWLNVLPVELFFSRADGLDKKIFPWLANTHTSESGETTAPSDENQLQMYWGMPRRIRLQSKETAPCQCDICGAVVEYYYSSFRTKNYGVNYDGEWLHNLTPYRFDRKKKNPPLSVKGQQGGLGYRHWLGLTLQGVSNGNEHINDGNAAAKVVSYFNEEVSRDLGGSHARLWCFGYDMDNMKARCWYEHTFPLFAISPAKQELLTVWVAELLNVAKQAAVLLRQQVKAAWFSRPKDVKGDLSGVEQSFWEQTETCFYRLLISLVEHDDNARRMPADVVKRWHDQTVNSAYDLFDHWTLETNPEDLNMRRIMDARLQLKRKLAGKIFKDFKQTANAQEQVA